MIKLHGFGPAFGLPDASPFVTKTEMLLKLSGRPYITVVGSLGKAPKGKLQFIEDDGVIVADSTLIRWHLESRYQIDFDEGLSPAERGNAWALEKLMEDNLYWIALRWRWLDDTNFARGPAVFFQRVPGPLRPLIESYARRRVRQALHAHGIGRHSDSEQLAIAAKGIDAIAATLGDKPYLMGEKPCGADATLFAFATSMLCPHFASPLRDSAERHANLIVYVNRLRDAFYPA
jgi:glutathione S-transferase